MDPSRESIGVETNPERAALGERSDVVREAVALMSAATVQYADYVPATAAPAPQVNPYTEVPFADRFVASVSISPMVSVGAPEQPAA